MTFFTHDQLIRAMRVLNPDLVHGTHYLTLMGINEDGESLSDAWIERWKSDQTQPTVEQLKQIYLDNNLDVQPVSQGAKTF